MNILITGKRGFLARELSYFFREHNVICMGRKSLDFTDAAAVESFFNINGYVDVVMHTAVDGGKRIRQDAFDTFSNNISMFSNLLQHKDKYGLMFCFGSGAEYDRQHPVVNVKEDEVIKCYPKDYYGLSKNIISQEMTKQGVLDSSPIFVNMRLFGCFGAGEDSQRFIKNSMNRVLEGKSITIKNNMEMDFFYVQDLCTVIDFYLKNIYNLPLPTEVNMVYEKKLQLKEIANIIKTVSGSSVPVATKIKGKLGYYTGDGTVLKNLGIPLKGLTRGIEEMWECLSLKKRYLN